MFCNVVNLHCTTLKLEFFIGHFEIFLIEFYPRIDVIRFY